MIPETDDRKPLGSQIGGAAIVLFHLEGMLPTIDFYDQQSFDADKITGIGPDSILPAKLVTGQGSIAQQIPQAVFGIGLVFSQPSGVVAPSFANRHSYLSGSPLTSALSPRGAREAVLQSPSFKKVIQAA